MKTDLTRILRETASVRVFSAQTFGQARVSMKEAADELERVYGGIRALQARCCGSDDLCNGCRALLSLLPHRAGHSSKSVGPARVFADADNNGENACVLPAPQSALTATQEPSRG